MKNPWKQYSKLNPQRENGNRQIATDVFRALMKAELSGSEFRIVMMIIDKTWGFKKESDCIAISQVVEATGLKERTVKESVQILKQKRIIVSTPSDIRVKKGSPLNEYCFNKHYDTWKTQGCRKVHGVRKSVLKGAEKGKIRVQKSASTKETITKETITKEKAFSQEFLKFYKSYPLRKEKKDAFKAWMKNKPDLEICLKAIEAQKIEKQRLRAVGQFCSEWKHPATWINKGCWEDEIMEPKKQSGSIPGKPNIARITILRQGFDVLQEKGRDSFTEFAATNEFTQEETDGILEAQP